MLYNMLGNGKNRFNYICSMKTFVFTLFTTICFNFSGQGLFEYFKLTADGDGPEKFDRIVVDANWNHWLNTPNGVDQGYYSFGVSTYWFKDMPIGKKSNFALALGLGFDSQNIHHNGQFIFEQDIDGNIFTDLVSLPEDYIIYKNKIALNYVDVPFEFRFRTMNKTIEDRMKFNFRFYVGFKAGVLVNDHLKIKDSETKIKVFNIPNVLKYRYGPTIRLGFNKIAFNAFYSLTNVFVEDKGVVLTPYSIGISWMRF